MGFVGKVKTQVDSSVTYNSVGSTLYGYCSSAGNSAAKEVNVGLTTLSGMNGITIHVQFKYANSAANPTLNVDGTGAKYIYQYNDVTPGNVSWDSWAAESVVSFTYDSDSDAWRMNDSGANKAIVNYLTGLNNTEVAAREAAITQVYSRIAPTYDSTATYKKNDLVIYGEQLYRCNDDITTAESWTAAHWTATTVAAEHQYKLVFTDTEIGTPSTATASIGESTGITAATVDRLVFEQIISTTGEYTFTYSGTDWMYNSQIVTITNYGITVTGTPVANDTVIVTYTAGIAPFVYNAAHEAEGFPYRSIVPLANVRSTMIPEVTFSLEDAIGGMFAPIVESYDGGIYVFATNEPPESITIPTIILWG